VLAIIFSGAPGSGAFSRIMVVTGSSATLPTHDVQAGDKLGITAADIAVDGTYEFLGCEDWGRDAIFFLVEGACFVLEGMVRIGSLTYRHCTPLHKGSDTLKVLPARCHIKAEL
jgi:hypothetical protein